MPYRSKSSSIRWVFSKSSVNEAPGGIIGTRGLPDGRSSELSDVMMFGFAVGAEPEPVGSFSNGLENRIKFKIY